MLKVKLVEELDQNRASTTADAESFVEEVKVLMAGDATKERNNLKAIGLGHSIVLAETKQGVDMERKAFETELGNKTFTQQEVMNLCLKYDLRLLPADKYRGTIEPSVGADLTRFLEKNGLSANHSSTSFHVMAPPRAFSLEDQPPLPRPVDLDPVLFYKVQPRDVSSQNTPPYYVLVKKWGRDFTIFRAFLGWKNRNPSNAFFFRLTITSMIMAVFAGFLFEPTSWFIAVPIAFVIAAVIAILTVGMTGGEIDFSRCDREFNEEKWNMAVK